MAIKLKELVPGSKYFLFWVINTPGIQNVRLCEVSYIDDKEFKVIKDYIKKFALYPFKMASVGSIRPFKLSVIYPYNHKAMKRRFIRKVFDVF